MGKWLKEKMKAQTYRALQIRMAVENQRQKIMERKD